jgi:hypothetical protein
MQCGICGKAHAGQYYKTKRHGFIDADCFIDLMDRAFDKADKPDQYTCENCSNRYTGFCDNCTTLSIADNLPSNFCPKEKADANKRTD